MAKLPAPTPEQQAAAALNAAKAAHAGKVDAYTLCLSQAKVADDYIKQQKAKGKAYTPEATPACVNPGPFVPPAATPAVAAAPPTGRRPGATGRRGAKEVEVDRRPARAPFGALLLWCPTSP